MSLSVMCELCMYINVCVKFDFTDVRFGIFIYVLAVCIMLLAAKLYTWHPITDAVCVVV